uniref:ISXO2-like transposase domain-containing protein n=1 Tax=Octopus bimaculoides TaxID=37653 RepID=A0A0L8FZW3_OCTBM
MSYCILSSKAAIIYNFDFVFEMLVTVSAVKNDINMKTAIQWHELCRDACLAKLLQDKAPLDGPKIYESLFFKWKNNVGRMGQRTWVVGCYDTITKKGFLCVPDRSTVTLENVIKEKVLPETIVVTDKWASYCNLQTFGYIHHTVNHAQNFVDPDTRACTNHIEAY